MEKLNYNMGAQKKLSLLAVTTDTATTHEISEEFNLPDYIPEVRKMLTVRAGVLPESKYLADKGSGSQLDFGGTVTYLVIYTDDEGNLCSTPLSSAYEASTQLSSHPETVLIDTVVDNTSVRVNAPRRLTIKARLKSRILGFENKVLEENITPKSSADEMYLQRAGKKIKSMEISQVSLQNIRMSDKLDMQGNKNAKPIWCDASLVITECKAQNKSILVRGEATVKCICHTEDGNITLTKVLPIVEEIEAEKSSVGDMASVYGRCISLAISNEMNDDTNQLFFDLNCELEGIVSHNREEYVTSDCYSTKCETDTSYKIIDTYSAVKSQNVSFTVSEAVKRKNNEAREIIEIIANPVCEKTEIKGQKASLVGKIEMNIIARCEEKENGEAEYVNDTYEIPFRYDTDLGKTADDIIVRNNLTIGSLNGRYDTDKLFVNCEIFLAQDIVEKAKDEILDTAVIKKDKEIKNDSACVRVYFPKDGDTLWEIAKKYHTTINKISDQNEIEASAEIPTKNLII